MAEKWQRFLCLWILIAARGGIKDPTQLEDEGIWFILVLLAWQRGTNRHQAAEVDAPRGDGDGWLSLRLKPQFDHNT